MNPPLSYCDAVLRSDTPEVHRRYHDEVYGYPVSDDNELFCRLVLELNQAGLSWTTILNKETNFRSAFDGFDVGIVASYGDEERSRLLADAGIIRNRLKVDATIHNAGVILTLQETHGSFSAWLDSHIGLSKAEWIKLFKQTFRFTGGEITNEFLMSTGYLPGAHVESCPIYRRIADRHPAWLMNRS